MRPHPEHTERKGREGEREPNRRAHTFGWGNILEAHAIENKFAYTGRRRGIIFKAAAAAVWHRRVSNHTRFMLLVAGCRGYAMHVHESGRERKDVLIVFDELGIILLL